MTVVDLLVIGGSLAMAVGLGGALAGEGPWSLRLFSLGLVGAAAFLIGCLLPLLDRVL